VYLYAAAACAATVPLVYRWCSAAGLVPLVEWNTRREIDTKVAELQEGLEKMMSADPPHSANDIISFVKSRKAEQVRIKEVRCKNTTFSATPKAILSETEVVQQLQLQV
jgi:hypothetical protein